LSQEVADVRRLVLWDIDGTLVLYGRIGRQAFADAFLAFAGRPAHDLDRLMISTAGRTDPDIALEFLARHGVTDSEARLDAFHAALVEALAAKAALMREHGTVLPGVERALAALALQPGVAQSLLTGNLEANAVLKLATFGLDRYVDLAIGAYGSDHRDRTQLVEVARAKAKARLGVEVDPTAVVVIGDTPLDVAAGRAGGARTVAVATGHYDVEALRATDPDAVLADLSDTDAVLQAILTAP
jgi:phosphoglycolate phosphatase-like HAD superfamily hydrolase